VVGKIGSELEYSAVASGQLGFAQTMLMSPPV
jgi:hypothetical protein